MVALGVIFLILSVVVIYLGGKLDVSWDVWSCTIGTVSLIIACIVLCVSICIYIDSMFTVADVHSFYEVNRDNYAVTITETKEAMLQVRANGGVNIPLENMQQSTNWSARISEYRDAVVAYNLDLRRLRMLNSNLILASVYANPSKGLKYIEMVTSE